MISRNAEHVAVYFPYVSYFPGLFILTLCLTDIPNCQLPPNTNLDDIKWALSILAQFIFSATLNSGKHSLLEKVSERPWSFLKFLFQHFLFFWTIKCWGPSGLISRPSSLFPILFLWVIFSSLMISNIIYICKLPQIFLPPIPLF